MSEHEAPRRRQAIKYPQDNKLFVIIINTNCQVSHTKPFAKQEKKAHEILTLNRSSNSPQLSWWMSESKTS